MLNPALVAKSAQQFDHHQQSLAADRAHIKVESQTDSDRYPVEAALDHSPIHNRHTAQYQDPVFDPDTFVHSANGHNAARSLLTASSIQAARALSPSQPSD
ncbi:Uncharacterised protein [Vibrio cholerae]|nr:Uncharacterised protein [Vibrio cholerae]CSD14146.1 Uncharacterised protein [Vibrio cholerae]